MEYLFSGFHMRRQFVPKRYILVLIDKTGENLIKK